MDIENGDSGLQLGYEGMLQLQAMTPEERARFLAETEQAQSRKPAFRDLLEEGAEGSEALRQVLESLDEA